MANQKSTGTINLIFIFALTFFVLIVFFPAVYILRYFSDFGIFFDSTVTEAVLASFRIGLVVTLLNIIFGIPLAWVMARSNSRVVKWMDNLVDLSLVMPTAALGFSIYLYWGSRSGLAGLFGMDAGLFSPGPIMIILLHLVFTLPYMIRSVTAAIQQIGAGYEEAAVTLGAGPLTFFRTVAMPLFKDGIINGSILTFTRSLSETGATMMVAGAFITAPVLIVNLKDQAGISTAVGASMFLIIVAVCLLLLTKLMTGKKQVRLVWAAPSLEKAISDLAGIRNAVLFLFFSIFIFFPTVHIVFFGLSNFSLPDVFVFLKSLVLSLGLAFVVTVINLIFSVPFAYLIARNRYGLGTVADTLSEIVLLIPTSALGLSLALFWRGFVHSDILILLFAHISFTFPLLVKPLSAALREISVSQEEAAYSLGASARKTYLSVLLPQIKPAIVAGSIMAFMRSLSETGATLAVTKNVKTISILIVDLFNSDLFAEAAFICCILFIITFSSLYYLKKIRHRTDSGALPV